MKLGPGLPHIDFLVEVPFAKRKRARPLKDENNHNTGHQLVVPLTIKAPECIANAFCGGSWPSS